MTTDTDTREMTALVAASPRIAQQIEAMRAQTAADIARSRSVTDLLSRSGAEWLKGASTTQVAAFARVCVGLGLNPLVGEAYLIHGTLYVGIQGRRKLAVQTGALVGEDAPRLLTPEERTIFGVKDGDVARIVEVWRTGWRMPAQGVGIVRKGEIANAMSGRKGPDGLPFMPLGRDPEGMAAKRAGVAAYKKGFPDLDLPTADVDRAGVHAQIIDSESGDVLSEGRRIAAPTEPGVEDPGREPRASESVIDEEPREGDQSVRGPDAPAPPTAVEIADHIIERIQASNPIAPGLPTMENVCTLLGVEALEHIEAVGLTLDDATEIVVTGWNWPDLAMPLSEIASKVHAARSINGQAFNAAAVLEADVPSAEPPPAAEEPAPPAKQTRAPRQEKLTDGE